VTLRSPPDLPRQPPFGEVSALKSHEILSFDPPHDAAPATATKLFAVSRMHYTVPILSPTGTHLAGSNLNTRHPAPALTGSHSSPNLVIVVRLRVPSTAEPRYHCGRMVMARTGARASRPQNREEDNGHG